MNHTSVQRLRDPIVRTLSVIGGGIAIAGFLIVCDVEEPQGAAGSAPTVVVSSDSFPVSLIDRGGLFGGGSNTPPPAYVDAAETSGSRIPATGAVVVGIGMSNGMVEFAAWERIADTDATLVNANCWGCTIQNSWDEPTDRGWSRYVPQALSHEGVAASDVDVVYMKMAHKHFEAADREGLEDVIAQIVAHFPNVKQIYVTDAIYRGWGDRSALPGSLDSYEPSGGWSGGPAARSVVLAHLGETDPFIGWGPYLWGDATDWPRELFEADGIHPNEAGAAKVADLLHSHFSTAPGTGWY